MATASTSNFLQPPATKLPERLESSEEYRNMFAMTQRIFPGQVDVRREQDPEFPEEYVVFAVEAHGSLEEVMARDAAWHRECGKLAFPSPHLYGLDLIVDDECA